MSFLPDKPRQTNIRKYALGGLVKMSPPEVFVTRVQGSDAPVKYFTEAKKAVSKALQLVKPKKLKKGGVVKNKK